MVIGEWWSVSLVIGEQWIVRIQQLFTIHPFTTHRLRIFNKARLFHIFLFSNSLSNKVLPIPAGLFLIAKDYFCGSKLKKIRCYVFHQFTGENMSVMRVYHKFQILIHIPWFYESSTRIFLVLSCHIVTILQPLRGNMLIFELFLKLCNQCIISKEKKYCEKQSYDCYSPGKGNFVVSSFWKF